MALPKLGNLQKSRRQLRQLAAAAESLDGTELVVCRPARSNEVRMIRVGQAVRARTRRGHDRPLLEEEYGPTCAGERERVSNRLGSLGVGDGVAAAFQHTQAHSRFVGDPCDELGALDPGGADLQVRRARTAERPATEQRPAEVRPAAACTRDDATRRSLERCQPRAEHSCFMQHLQGMVVPRDVKLVPRAPVEGVARVGPDLRGNAKRTQQAERAPGDGWIGNVEVDSNFAAALEVNASGGVEEP